MKPPVTLICTYSERECGIEYLTAMIESIAAQDYHDLTLLICADRVGYKYSLTVHDLLGESGITFDHIDNTKKQGRSPALQECLDMIEPGHWVGLIDSDDLLAEPDAISQMIDMALASSADAVSCDRAVIDADGNLINFQFALAPDNCQWHKCLTGKYPFHLTLWRSELLAEVGINTDLTCAVDYDLVLKLLEHNPKMCFLSKALYKYRVHQDQISSNREAQVLASVGIVRESIQRMGGTQLVRLNWVVI
jgi:glycosyltransferase involved in cell wall biosynthesis